MKPPFHVTNLQTVIADLLQRHQATERLELTRNGQTLLVEPIKPQVVRLAYFAMTDDGYPVLERDVLFFLDAEGQWIPYKTRYLTTHTYALHTVDEALLLLDPDNQMALALYCENWAVALQDWADLPEPAGETPAGATWNEWMDTGRCEATHGR